MDRQDLMSGTRRKVPQNSVWVTAADHFDGYQIMQYHGLAWGISIRARNLGSNCAMGCQQMAGGELSSYTELSYETRQQALDRMIDTAKRLGGNAVIKTQFDIFEQGEGSVTEIISWGTVVTINPIENYVPVGAVGNILLETKHVLESKT